ncbi:hypothetical protein GIB67_005191 [Kingdonia uniflora]|uniref:Cellulose synthase n=1 Tax=Kingdonia uniflora TaxID=39325 RepID=A0A7J7NN10_9MAGN|nr:hypothetical protein GIB67_005191 [Kingdonia uniflora]
MSLWAEHTRFLEDIFTVPKNLECVRRVRSLGESRQFATEDVSEMRGHLLKYPMEVDPRGKVFLGQSGGLDTDRNQLPRLVYVSREKRHGHNHHKKAGAMNALVRVSVVLTNAPYLLNLDCDHYINNSKALGEGNVFYDESIIGEKSMLCAVFTEINMKGLDGIQGPIYVGTGCVFRRQALYGFDAPKTKKPHLLRTCNCLPKWAHCGCCCSGKKKKKDTKAKSTLIPFPGSKWLKETRNILDRMLLFYNSEDQKGNQFFFDRFLCRKKILSLFSIFLFIGLRNIATEFIKLGMWDGLYDAFHSIGQHICTSPPSSSAELETIEIEPPCKRDASQQSSLHKLNNVTVVDIGKSIAAYFEHETPITREAKSPFKTQLSCWKKLCDCELWLTKKFPVNDFDSLGYGEFL